MTKLSFLASRIGLVIENDLEHEMLAKNQQGLQHMIYAIGEEKSIRIVYLLDTPGRVILTLPGQSVGTRLDTNDTTSKTPAPGFHQPVFLD